MEFQAVIMAAGRGTRMMDLTSSVAKALLPVANMPMIWYPIRTLEKAGFEEAIVIVQKNHMQDIQKTLVGVCNVKLRLEFVAIPSNEDWGTADSLRFIKDKVKSDLLVISCDVMTDVPLHHLADLHRVNDATMTLMLAPLLDTTDLVAPGGGKASKKMEKDLIGLDKTGKKIVFFASEADFEENVTMKKSFFKKNPFVTISTHLLDSHIYLLKKSILDFIVQKDGMSVFKGEVLPFLVKKQSTYQPKPEVNDPSETSPDSVESHISSCESEMEKCAFDLSTYRAPPSDEIRCYAYCTTGSEFCLRANTVLTYCEANRQVQKRLSSFFESTEPIRNVHPSVTKQAKSQVGQDSLIGEGSIIGEKAGIKRSIVGRHCKIEEKVKITNCIVMDHAIIKSGASITGSIISKNSEVGEKTELKECLVGGNQHVMAMGKFNNDVIVDKTQMMEI